MFEAINYNSHQIGLMDCNNFFVSCERVFRPDLRNRPVGVLSNNDRCIIARSNELKALGVEMAAPLHEVENIIKRHNVVLFSSNYELYADMSTRIMSSLSSYVPDIEIYSIDECFLNFSGFNKYDLKEYGEKITSEVSQGTGIPLSLGIAPTKTLAKLANRFAKKYPAYKGTCVINSQEKHIKALQLTDIRDIWGIGRRLSERLKKYNIRTAYDLILKPQAWIRKETTVVGERMWKELCGIPSIDLELQAAPKKTICTSRTFGTATHDLEVIKEAVANYAALCAAKMRRQKTCANHVMVFIHTNEHNERIPQHSENRIINLPTPTNITSEIIRHTLLGLETIYRTGFEYNKAGVIVMDMVSEDTIQQNLFDPYNQIRKKQRLVMPVIDKFNFGFNQTLLTSAAQIGKNTWKMKQERRSPRYTTRVSDFMKIKL